MPLQHDRKYILISGLALALLVAFVAFTSSLRPILPRERWDTTLGTRVFVVESGEGFRRIAERLQEENFIRSAAAFKALAFFDGKAGLLKPGRYEFSGAMSGFEILKELTEGARKEVGLTFPEGSTIYDIDALLAGNGILTSGSFSAYASSEELEGRLFPDTYRFLTDSTPEEVAKKFLDNFEERANKLFSKDPTRIEEALILASLLEKEIPDFEERRIAAGVLKKRIRNGVPLQVDATICYLKRLQESNPGVPCAPLRALDFKIDSPYNTYLYRGWPPGPISNPGLSALEAALNPKESPYWYYISDPKTGKTIFAETLEEHNHNRRIYLNTDS